MSRWALSAPTGWAPAQLSSGAWMSAQLGYLFPELLSPLLPARSLTGALPPSLVQRRVWSLIHGADTMADHDRIFLWVKYLLEPLKNRPLTSRVPDASVGVTGEQQY